MLIDQSPDLLVVSARIFDRLLLIEVVTVGGLEPVAGAHVELQPTVLVGEEGLERLGNLDRPGAILTEIIDERSQSERVRPPRRFPHLLQDGAEPHVALAR